MNRLLELTITLLDPDERQRLAELEQQLDAGQLPRKAQIFGRHSQPSYFPIAVIYLVCCRAPYRWSAFELCRRFWSCWRSLPEDAKCGRATPEAHHLISLTLELVNNCYESVYELLHSGSSAPAIISPENGTTITHKALTKLVSSFALPPTGASKPVVAISLPNGPLLAAVLVATATFYTAAPLQHGPGIGPDQFKRDVLQSGSNFVLAGTADVERLRLRDPWLAEARIHVLLIEIAKGEFVIRNLSFERLKHTSWAQPNPNRAGDIAILLFTSGTSGAKKLVPLHIESLITGVSMVQSSWALTAQSRCLNQMPLNHVGGIVRNLFAPLLSGGSVICCSGFDANAFWDAVEDYAPTWYYASPTMHQCILEAALDRPGSVAKSQITLICNAAGGLLPSLATLLRDTFSRPGLDCVVLPSYGMTECMPISTPPMNYRLDRTGTSGVSVGPEIAILDSRDGYMHTGTVGRIAVRGAPVFAGYLKDGQLDRTCFTKDSWFDTGDMGYLDKDGFLYITGRSKEVINRGGELISPFEIEDSVLAAARDPSSPIFGRVSKALAFSVTHDVLQEVVGLVVVTPMDCKRPCLKTIQEATKNSLASVKVPVLLVYMSNDLPTNNGKVLRIRLAERLGIASVSDSTQQDDRYYEAICPPVNTPLGTGIRSRRLLHSPEDLDVACRALLPPAIDFHIDSSISQLHPVLRLAPVTYDAPVSVWNAGANDDLKSKLLANLDAYCVPSRIDFSKSPFIRDESGIIVNLPLQETRAPKRAWSGDGQARHKIMAAFAEILEVPVETLNGESNFFELGGDSMKAGRLLSALRKSFATRITIDVLFSNSTIGSLTAILDVAPVAGARDSLPAAGLVKSLPGCARTRSSTNVFVMLLQLLPIGIFAPMRRALTWTIFIYCLTFSATLPTQNSLPGRFINLVVSLLIGKVVTEIFVPPLAVLLKWLIIGVYEEGLYPMWGSYHTRWWLVQKILSVAGLGIYEHTAFTRTTFYRCLGAHIGHNVTIDKDAKLGEYDLLYIEDNAVLDACTVRPFAVERNTSMYLGRIRIGRNASIGQASFVAAGTIVPADACIGANSSSWELDDADEANRELSPSKTPKPHWTLELFLGLPLTVIAYFVGGIPWMGGLMPLVITEPEHGHADSFRAIVLWFSSPQRVVFHYVALACRAAIGPVFFFFTVLAIKKMLDACCGGPIQPGPARSRSQMDRFRMDLMQKLMPDSQFHKLTTLFGTHYSSTSWFARQMGAKVGKNVYWPGKGPLIQNFDMIDIGDNVVFGSRSSIVTSDGFGLKPVRIENNAMIADRVILRPGTVVGQRTVMGSGALSQRSKHYPSDTTWVGSKKNDAICLMAEMSPPESPTPHNRSRGSTESAMYDDKGEKHITVNETEFSSRTSSMTELKAYENGTFQSVTIQEQQSISSPFGKAFYDGLASYRVWGQTTIAIYSTFITLFAAVFWNIHSITAIQIVAWLYNQPHYRDGFLRDRETRPLFIYAFFTALIAAIMAVQVVVALAIVIASKWIIIGRRQQGNYDWDKSSYCQRWQLFLKIESLRQKCYGGHGVLGLLTGTHWIVLYFKALGANIGKDCALFASGTPSLYFTEPDLLTLGDRVSVDDASLVCHINTRGKFDLNPLFVGDRSVLRSGSRLLSGARMEDDSCLLEHTLVMAGDVVDAETAIQGWPGDEFKGNRLPTMRVAYHWETA